MNKDQFFNRHKNSNIHEAEIERKWRLFQEQHSQEQWLLEAAAAGAGSASVGGAGGGGTVTPQSLVKNGQNVSIVFSTAGVPNLQCITASANGPEGKVTITDIGVPSSSSIFYNECINNGGSMYVGSYFDSTVNASVVFFSLIDGEGNHVMTDTHIDDENWDTRTFEGNIIAWGYFINNEGLGDTYQARWWDGFNVNTQIYTNVDFVDWDVFSNWDVTLDGTISIGVTTLDEVSSKYMLTSNGSSIRFDDKLKLANGRTPYSTQADIGNNSICVTYYNDDIYDVIKILKTDGTVYTLDISIYDADNLATYATGFGWIFATNPDVNTTDVAVIFWDETLNAFEVYNAGPEVNIENFEVKRNSLEGYFDYDNSVESCNNATIVLSGVPTDDTKMNRFDDLRIINKFAGVPYQTWDTGELIEPTSFAFYSADHCANPTFLCNVDGNNNLQILTFSAEEWTIQNTDSAYADVSDYFEIRAMGKYAMVQWYDTSRVAAQEQTFQILENNTIIDTILTSTANSWDTNYDTAWVQQQDENLTYYFTPTAGEWLNFGPDYADRWYSDNTNEFGRDYAYVGGHNFGTTLFNTSGDNYAVLTRDTIDNIDYIYLLLLLILCMMCTLLII
jgi:hypothetical protein